MKTYDHIAGHTPLLVSMPHNGTAIPEPMRARMTEAARRLPDTDWHMDRLYAFATGLGASMLCPTYSRFVIDLNRAPDGGELYAGARNTELCPLTCFDDSPIYLPGRAPSEDETRERIERFWKPYHEKLASLLQDLLNKHGIALLFDAHSIRSEVPRFFDGRLPDLNLGTAAGTSCDSALERELVLIASRAPGFTHVLNGRFKGGFITRNYGDPARGVHAVQLELSQITYMDEDHPYTYREERADQVQPVLRSLLDGMLAWP